MLVVGDEGRRCRGIGHRSHTPHCATERRGGRSHLKLHHARPPRRPRGQSLSAKHCVRYAESPSSRQSLPPKQNPFVYKKMVFTTKADFFVQHEIKKRRSPQLKLTFFFSFFYEKRRSAYPYAGEVFVCAAEEASVGVDGNRRHPSPLDRPSVVHHINLSASHGPGHRGLALNLLRETAKPIEANGTTIRRSELLLYTAAYKEQLHCF